MAKRCAYQGRPRPTSVEVRSTQITELMPMVSGMRHSKNPAAIVCATVLQAAIRDLERLNDVEMCCFQYGLKLSRRAIGPTDSSRTLGSQTLEGHRPESQTLETQILETQTLASQAQEFFTRVSEILSKV